MQTEAAYVFGPSHANFCFHRHCLPVLYEQGSDSIRHLRIRASHPHKKLYGSRDETVSARWDKLSSIVLDVTTSGFSIRMIQVQFRRQYSTARHPHLLTRVVPETPSQSTTSR